MAHESRPHGKTLPGLLLRRESIVLVIQVASGTLHTPAELHGHNDFISWKRGVSLQT